MKLLFFDLETTGFGAEKCAIIQLGGIMCDLSTDMKLTPVDAINIKMKPRKGKWIDKRALEVTDMQLSDVLTWKDDRDQFMKFIKFLDKHCDRFNKLDKIKLAGYNNAHFDQDFLRQWFLDNDNQFYGAYFWSDCIDVMCEASRYLTFYRMGMNNFTLGNVAYALGIEPDKSQLHDGMYDIKITFKIFKKILESEKLILPFDEETAVSLFNQQRDSKDLFVKHKSLITEEDAWIQA